MAKELYCPACRHVVKAKVCGKSRASRRYVNVHYCCPYCSEYLGVSLVEW